MAEKKASSAVMEHQGSPRFRSAGARSSREREDPEGHAVDDESDDDPEITFVDETKPLVNQAPNTERYVPVLYLLYL